LELPKALFTVSKMPPCAIWDAHEDDDIQYERLLKRSWQLKPSQQNMLPSRYTVHWAIL